MENENNSYQNFPPITPNSSSKHKKILVVAIIIELTTIIFLSTAIFLTLKEKSLTPISQMTSEKQISIPLAAEGLTIKPLGKGLVQLWRGGELVTERAVVEAQLPAIEKAIQNAGYSTKGLKIVGEVPEATTAGKTLGAAESGAGKATLEGAGKSVTERSLDQVVSETKTLNGEEVTKLNTALKDAAKSGSVDKDTIYNNLQAGLPTSAQQDKLFQQAGFKEWWNNSLNYTEKDPSTFAQNGWIYKVNSDTPSDFRFVLNPTDGNVVKTFEDLTKSLESKGIPYEAKMPEDPLGHALRDDRVLVWVPKENANDAYTIIKKYDKGNPQALEGRAVPSFYKETDVPGVGVASEPKFVDTSGGKFSGTSFVTERAQRVAEGVAQNIKDNPGIIDKIAEKYPGVADNLRNLPPDAPTAAYLKAIYEAPEGSNFMKRQIETSLPKVLDQAGYDSTAFTKEAVDLAKSAVTKAVAEKAVQGTGEASSLPFTKEFLQGATPITFGEIGKGIYDGIFGKDTPEAKEQMASIPEPTPEQIAGLVPQEGSLDAIGKAASEIPGRIYEAITNNGTPEDRQIMSSIPEPTPEQTAGLIPEAGSLDAIKDISLTPGQAANLAINVALLADPVVGIAAGALAEQIIDYGAPESPYDPKAYKKLTQPPAIGNAPNDPSHPMNSPEVKAIMEAQKKGNGSGSRAGSEDTVTPGEKSYWDSFKDLWDRMFQRKDSDSTAALTGEGDRGKDIGQQSPVPILPRPESPPETAATTVPQEFPETAAVPAVKQPFNFGNNFGGNGTMEKPFEGWSKEMIKTVYCFDQKTGTFKMYSDWNARLQEKGFPGNKFFMKPPDGKEKSKAFSEEIKKYENSDNEGKKTREEIEKEGDSSTVPEGSEVTTGKGENTEQAGGGGKEISGGSQELLATSAQKEDREQGSDLICQ